MIFIFLFFTFSLLGQSDVLVMGNHQSICLEENAQFELNDTLPITLDNYGAVMLFSGASSSLTEHDLERLILFVEDGGGLYSGAENWPLQAESNQVTYRLYKKESFGQFERQAAEANKIAGNLQLDSITYLPAGSSTVAFPMDYRLQVEAWVDDQPLILTGQLAEGRIIVDGGYSRFYCDQRNQSSDVLFRKMLEFLLQE